MQQPLYLILIIPYVLLIYWWWSTQRRVGSKKRYLILTLRIIFFLSLILSLAKIELLFPIQGKSVIFVVDQSASMKNDLREVSFIKEAIESKEEEDKFAIISVAAEASIEQPLTSKKDIGLLGNVINPHTTNLAEGIRLASGMMPSNTSGKIVLITDGLDNQGDLPTELKLATERGITVDVFSIQHDVGEEVAISSFKVPNILHLNEEFQGKVIIESTVSTKGVLRFYEGNQEIGLMNVTIEKGINNFLFKEKAEKTGFHKFRVELTAVNDTLNINNHAYAFTQIKDDPKILVLEGHENAAQNLISSLSASNIIIDKRPISLLPRDLEDYKQYSAIILADLQATQINNGDMERIRTSVRDLGIGLIMTGGGDSYGLGGWFKTPIEEALPVYMDIQDKEKLPSLGLMLVIDKSGSMSVGENGINKMELAKEAAFRATEMLKEKDMIGVVAFDGSPWVIVEPESTANIADIQKKISGINADGGTDIYPALETAYNYLEKINVQRKHIILLTDGQSGRDNQYQALLNDMNQKNITVSTVAIGNDSDTALLEEIARLGKGRYYFSNDPTTIPKIFSKETALASRSFIVNKPHVPEKVSIGEWTSLNESLPVIKSYIATTPKQTSDINLISIEGDPILARWQYGLGRAVAWTSDLEGKWAYDWVTWKNFNEIWNQLVSWTFPRIEQGEWFVETESEGMNVTLNVTVSGNTLPQQMEAVIINDKMEAEKIKLKPVSLNKLQARITTNDQGTYLLQIIEKEGDKIIASQTEGFVIPYSPEYRITENGSERIRNITDLSGGKILDNGKDVFSQSEVDGFEKQDLSNLLLILAAIIWPIDIGVRRINLSAVKITQRLNSDNKKSEGNRKSASAGKEETIRIEADTFERLLKAKNKKKIK